MLAVPKNKCGVTFDWFGSCALNDPHWGIINDFMVDVPEGIGNNKAVLINIASPQIPSI